MPENARPLNEAGLFILKDLRCCSANRKDRFETLISCCLGRGDPYFRSLKALMQPAIRL